VETALRTCVTQHKPALLLCAGACDANTQAVATAVLCTFLGEGQMVPHQIYSCRIQGILKPLVITANITQAAHTQLNHVLLMLDNLFCIYLHPSLESQIKELITGSLEKHWAKADQNVFILAIFFNPYICQ
jgi:hypothetical protein